MTDAKIYITGVIGQDTTLLDVIRQYKSFPQPSGVEVHIDSPGGSVDQGKAIFNYLRQLNIPVRTHAVRAYSIAAHIFMAGQERVVDSGPDRIMIHFPWAEMSGRSDDFEKMSKELKAVEKEFVQFYSAYLNTDEATIAKLLESESMLSGEDAATLGFATTVETPLKAVAFIPEPQTQKKTIMKKAESLMKALQSFLTMDAKEEAPEVQALVLQDANGVEINFPDVAEGESPEIGDMAEVDGAPAEGEFVAPDGSVWVFSAGSLTEVRPAEETEEEAETAEDGAPAEDDSEEMAQIEKMLKELFGRAKEEAAGELSAEIVAIKGVNEALNAEIQSLKKLIVSKDIEIEEQPKKKPSGNIFR